MQQAMFLDVSRGLASPAEVFSSSFLLWVKGQRCLREQFMHQRTEGEDHEKCIKVWEFDHDILLCVPKSEDSSMTIWSIGPFERYFQYPNGAGKKTRLGAL